MEPQDCPIVAVVRADRRRDAVAQALCLIDEQVRAVVRPEVVVKPNLVSHRRQTASTHADAFSATLDAIFAAGAKGVVVAEGASDAPAGFERFGLRGEAAGRPVRFLDINRDETCWSLIDLQRADRTTTPARVSRTILDAECRVSLALMKTHVISMVTFGLKNMLSSVHPEDRPLMHGNPPGKNGYSGWRKHLVEFLKGDNAAVNALTRTMGRVRLLKNRLRGCDRPDAFERLSESDLRFLRSVVTLNRNLAILATHTRPHLTVLDGFDAMHREGPRHGTPIRLGLAIAGTDPLAVDTVATALMGFDPAQVGYLQLAQAYGVGVADLRRIKVVGDPIASVRHQCVGHSNASIARHWARLTSESTIPGPHLALAREHARS